MVTIFYSVRVFVKEESNRGNHGRSHFSTCSVLCCLFGKKKHVEDFRLDVVAWVDNVWVFATSKEQLVYMAGKMEEVLQSNGLPAEPSSRKYSSTNSSIKQDLHFQRGIEPIVAHGARCSHIFRQERQEQRALCQNHCREQSLLR